MYTIMVVGAGYTGSRIARHFKFKNQKVISLSRNPENLKPLQEIGVTTLAIDLTRPGALSKVPPAHFVVIAVAPDERTPAAYRDLYIEGVWNFLKAMRSNVRPFLIVYLSSARVYGMQQSGILTEDDPPQPDSDLGKILLEAEDQFMRSGFSGTIFRLAGIYGPGRNRVRMFKEKRWPAPRDEKIMNMIHVDDLVAALTVLFKRSQPGNVYLGVDHCPVAETEFYDWLSSRLGIAYPKEVFRKKEALEGKRYSNEKLKSLNFSFTYPDFRSGYEKILGEALRSSA